MSRRGGAAACPDTTTLPRLAVPRWKYQFPLPPRSRNNKPVAQTWRFVLRPPSFRG